MEPSKDLGKRGKNLGAQKLDLHTEIEQLRRELEKKYSHLPEARKNHLIEMQVEAFKQSHIEVSPSTIETSKEDLSLKSSSK